MCSACGVYFSALLSSASALPAVKPAMALFIYTCSPSVSLCSVFFSFMCVIGFPLFQGPLMGPEVGGGRGVTVVNP